MNKVSIKSYWTFGQQVISNMFRPKQLDANTWFYPINVGTFSQVEALKTFLEVPEVSAVLIRKATGYSNGRFKVVNKNGVEKQNDHVNKLLGKPNWFQSQKEYMMQTCLFHEIFGNEYLYLFTGMKTPRIDNVSALYTLPPNLVCAEYADMLPFFLFGADEQPKLKYSIKHNGTDLPIETEKIIHLNENRVNFKSCTDKDLINGVSQIELLRAPINNIRMAYESRGVILKFRGALGMVTPNNKDATGRPIALDSTEIDEINKRYANTYGGLSNQFQIMVSSVDLKWQQMGVNPDKLGLMKETEEDFRKIKDAWQAPDELFASEKGSTYENQNQAWKRWYENCIIPDANERNIALNERLMDGNFFIVADYSHLPIFQEDIKHRTEALNQMVTALNAALMSKQISSDEYRAELKKAFDLGTGKALPIEAPSADNQEVETRSAQAALRGSVGGVQGILAIQSSVSMGTTTRESAISMLTIVFGFTPEDANRLLGEPQDVTPEQQTQDVQTLSYNYGMKEKTIKLLFYGK